MRELLGLSWQNCFGSPEKVFFEIWYLTYLPTGFGIHMKCRARFSVGSRNEGCQIGFFGNRDFPYLKLGIRDLIRASFAIESIRGRWDAKTNPCN